MARGTGKKTGRGFTLVEMAVSLAIIGLLIGATLKAFQYLRNARVTKTIVQVENVRGAVESFAKTYSQWPGDMANATSRLPNCVAANFCANGNADNKVGVVFDLADNDDALTFNQSLGGVNGEPETVQFWKHLAMSDLITGVVIAGNPADPAWGVTHPTSAYGHGGYNILYSPGGGLRDDGTNTGYSGHYLRLQNPIVGAAVGDFNENVMPSTSALNLDRKMDDGHLGEGHVVAGGPGCRDNVNAGLGATVFGRRNCAVWFHLD